MKEKQIIKNELLKLNIFTKEEIDNIIFNIYLINTTKFSLINIGKLSYPEQIENLFEVSLPIESKVPKKFVSFPITNDNSNTSTVVDMILLSDNDKIGLIERKFPPFGFAIPGGFIDNNETPINAVIREVEEEISIKLEIENIEDKGVQTGIETRGILHTNLFICKIPEINMISGDDAEKAEWVSISKLREIMLSGGMVPHHTKMIIENLGEKLFKNLKRKEINEFNFKIQEILNQQNTWLSIVNIMRKNIENNEILDLNTKSILINVLNIYSKKSLINNNIKNIEKVEYLDVLLKKRINNLTLLLDSISKNKKQNKKVEINEENYLK
jgi:ADP-ribose pyrophosphatase YjhB (NUDIX family)